MTEKTPELMPLGWAFTVEPEAIVIGSRFGSLSSETPFALAPVKFTVPKFASGGRRRCWTEPRRSPPRTRAWPN